MQERLAANPSAEDVAGLQTQITGLEGQVSTLTAERVAAEQAAAVKSLETRLDALLSTTAARKFTPAFNVNRGAELAEPLAVSLYKAKKYSDPDALQVAAKYRSAMKALSEGTTTAGGFLVAPQYMQQELIELRRASAPLRNFVNVVGGIRSNVVYVPSQSGASTVAWTAENATKTASDQTLGQISVNIFTLAGIVKVSNQLLEDSSPAVDQIVRNDLGRSLGIEEDRTMINGSGAGQPMGIIGTSGVTTTAASAQTAASILDDIAAAIGRLQAAYFGQPDGILMHPRTWTKLITAKDTTGRYLGMGTVVGNQNMNLPGLPNPTGSAPGPMATLFGIPVIIDANVPTALTVGANANRSVIVVGAFKEAWLLERDGITLDVSAEAGTSFESNQTWFRGEERAGFTAARQVSAFQVVSDVGP